LNDLKKIELKETELELNKMNWIWKNGIDPRPELCIQSHMCTYFVFLETDHVFGKHSINMLILVLPNTN